MRIIVFKLLFGYGGYSLAVLLGENQAIGLFIGLMFGHILDYQAGAKFLEWRYQRIYKAKAEAQFQNKFLGSLFFMFGKICGCDGAISKEEIKSVDDIISQAFKLNKRDRKQAINAFRSARESKESFQSKAVQYFEIYKSQPQVLEGTIQMFMNIAAADNKLNEQEEKFIHTAATVFGIDEERYQRMKIPFLDVKGQYEDIEKSYALLGCRPNDSEGDIKRSYRKLVSEYHPDKIVHKGLPEEFIKFANQKMKDIQGAYEAVKSERGFT